MAGAAPLKAPPSLKVDVWLFLRFKKNEESEDLDKSKAIAFNIKYVAALDSAEAATGHQSHRDVDVWMLQCPLIWFNLLDVSASLSATQDW